MNIELTLHPCDLKPEFQARRPDGHVCATVNVNLTEFHMFVAAAQAEVIRIGRAVYWDRGMYNAILPPEIQWSVSEKQCKILENQLRVLFSTYFAYSALSMLWHCKSKNSAFYDLLTLIEKIVIEMDDIWTAELLPCREDLRAFLKGCK